MLNRPKSTVSIRNNNFKFNFNASNSSNFQKLSNNNNNFNINQSPKIFSGKMRYIFEDKKLFSLIDLNEKITNSKGPSLPIQFKRLTSEEIHKLFNGSKTDRYEKLKKLKYTSIKDTLLGRIIIPKGNNKETNIVDSKKEVDKKNEKKSNEINIADKGNNLEENKIKERKKIIDNTNSNNVKEETNIDKKVEENKSKKKEDKEGEKVKEKEKKKEKEKEKEKEFIKRPNTSIYAYKQKINTESEKTEIIKEKKINNNNDIWMPTNYKDYEETVKDRKVFFQRMKENPFNSRLPTCTLKEIQAKSNSTDIFFVKPPKLNSKFNYFKNFLNSVKNQKSNCYYNSDIFNIKNDELSLKKIGEKYLFQIPQNVKYTSSRESHSEWKSDINGNSINNCSSKEYNILIPNRRNYNLTKEKAYKTLDSLNYNKNNPISKQRSVSKFIDLANNKKCNFGKDYMYCYQTNQDCFKKVAEHCSSYGDLFLEYKNLCDRPFYKKNLITE